MSSSFANPSPFNDSLAPIIAVSGATTLLASQSGSIINLTSAGADYIVTLPAPQNGLNFKFNIVQTAGTNQVELQSSGANCIGYKILGATPSSEATAKQNIFLGNSTGPVASTAGDKVEMWCNGTSYIWNGYGVVAASIRTS